MEEACDTKGAGEKHAKLQIGSPKNYFYTFQPIRVKIGDLKASLINYLPQTKPVILGKMSVSSPESRINKEAGQSHKRPINIGDHLVWVKLIGNQVGPDGSVGINGPQQRESKNKDDLYTGGQTNPQQMVIKKAPQSSSPQSSSPILLKPTPKPTKHIPKHKQRSAHHCHAPTTTTQQWTPQMRCSSLSSRP